MATKRRTDGGKRVSKRVQPDAATPKEAGKKTEQEDEPERSRIPERIQEKDSGFGVIKIVAGLIVVLIIGAGILSQYTGNDAEQRGDKAPGEACDESNECRAGARCISHKAGPKRCFELCTEKDADCGPGFTCTTTAVPAGRKKNRVLSICVEDAKDR